VATKDTMTLHHRGLLGTPCRPAAGLDPAPVEARRASYASRSRHGGSLRTSRAIRCNHRRDHVGGDVDMWFTWLALVALFLPLSAQTLNPLAMLGNLGLGARDED